MSQRSNNKSSWNVEDFILLSFFSDCSCKKFSLWNFHNLSAFKLQKFSEKLALALASLGDDLHRVHARFHEKSHSRSTSALFCSMALLALRSSMFQGLLIIERTFECYAHLCQRKGRHRFCRRAFLFADQRQSVWIDIWSGEKGEIFCSKHRPINYLSSQACIRTANANTYGTPTRLTIGNPKNGGTFSSIIVWVLRKLSVGSGSDFESLWHEPGRCGQREEDLQCENVGQILIYLCEDVSLSRLARHMPKACSKVQW